MNKQKILAIIVAYYPNSVDLSSLVDALNNQVTEILIIDNTPAENDNLWEILKEKVAIYPLRVVRFGKNLGIATGINIGINIALAESFSHVLLSDQDSLPLPGMVAGLLQAEQKNSTINQHVGAVGPVYIDAVTGLQFPFQVQRSNRLFYSREYVNPKTPDVKTLSLISSGTLIKTSVFQKVGAMREDFFIDHVDVEWCHRAISKGYTLVGTHRGLMQHRMGDTCLRVWFFNWRYINGYGPARLYYRFRNFIYLLRLSYVPLLWKIRASWYWVGNFYAHAIFASNRRENIKAMTSGIWDGLKANMNEN